MLTCLVVKPTEVKCLQEYLNSLRQRQQGHLQQSRSTLFMRVMLALLTYCCLPFGLDPGGMNASLLMLVSLSRNLVLQR